jgi:hypothetical protein
MKWLMLFSLFTSSLYAADSINSITGPSTLTKGKDVTVIVDYETEDKDLVFILQL